MRRRRYRLVTRIRAIRDPTDDKHSRVTFAVLSCSACSDLRCASIDEMEEVAWILRSDPRHKTVGFVHAKQLRPHLRHVLSDGDCD
jgi:hypothetical protein